MGGRETRPGWLLNRHAGSRVDITQIQRGDGLLCPCQGYGRLVPQRAQSGRKRANCIFLLPRAIGAKIGLIMIFAQLGAPYPLAQAPSFFSSSTTPVGANTRSPEVATDALKARINGSVDDVLRGTGNKGGSLPLNLKVGVG